MLLARVVRLVSSFGILVAQSSSLNMHLPYAPNFCGYRGCQCLHCGLLSTYSQDEDLPGDLTVGFSFRSLVLRLKTVKFENKVSGE